MLYTERSLEIAHALLPHIVTTDEEVYLAFDTSGGIPNDLLSDYSRVIDYLLRNLSIKAAYVMQFDTAVSFVARFQAGKDASCKDMRWFSGGGTLLRPVIKMVAENVKGQHTRVLVFTDGMFSERSLPEESKTLNVEPFLIVPKETNGVIQEGFSGVYV